MSTSTALVPHRGPGVAGARSWADVPLDERHRRAVVACQTRDRDELCALADAWLTVHGSAGAHVSAYTRRNYKKAVRQLLDDWPHTDLLHPGPDSGSLWVRGMEERGLATDTIKVHLAGARTLYKALRWACATDADPFRDVHAPRDPIAPEDKGTFYTTAQIATLLRHVHEPVDAVIILLGADAGLRVGEMLRVRWKDVDRASGTLHVHLGKGRRSRTITMSPRLQRALAAHRDDTGPDDLVFRFRTQARVYQRLTAVCARAAVPMLGIHSLRHTAGARMYRESQSIEVTAMLLGHKQVTTSQRYAHMTDERVGAITSTWD